MFKASIPINASPHVEFPRKAALVLLVALVTAMAAFCVYYHVATHRLSVMMCKPAGEMDWLRMEFNLTDEQFVKIKALEEAYQPKCGQMCMRIMEANENLDKLITTNPVITPQVEEAFKQYAAAQDDCHKAMLEHIYAVGAEMSPAGRDRYLLMMKKWIIEPRLAPDTAVSRPPGDK